MQDEIDPEGQKRIAQLISKALKQPTKPKGYDMPATGQTRTVKAMKDEIAKTKAKRSTPVDKQVDNSSPIGNPPVSNEEQTAMSNGALHRQPTGNSTVSYNTREHIVDKELKGIEVKGKSINQSVLGQLDVSDFDFLIEAKMTPEQIEQHASFLLPLFQAEGLTPSSRVLADSILQLHRDAR